MNNLTKILSTAALGLTVAFGATVSHAAPVPIGTCSVNDVNLGLTSSSTPKANDCENYAGNDSSPLNAFGTTWTFVTKDEYPNESDIKEGIWDFSDQTLPLDDPFVIVLKAANFFAAYLINVEDTDGKGWFTTAGVTGDKPHGISHISLYTSVSEVPVPAALWLFAPALLGLMGFRRRNNKV